MTYPNERRSGRDRRQVSLGPPAGVEERRWLGDRRHTFVDEVQLTDTDWESLFHVPRASITPSGS